MSKKKNKKLVPNLRFKGFTDDWIQEKLETQVTDLKSYPLPRKFETTEESSYRYVHYGDIHTGIANIINNVEDLPKIVNGKYETLDKGDLILADASEDYQGIAWPAILNVDPQENVLAGLHTIALRPNPNIDSMFLYYTFLNTDFRKFGYRMGTGMKVFGISKKNLYKYNLSKPINIEEQERISSLLIKLNNIITLEQEKIEKIRALRSGLYQVFFLRAKEVFPKIYFKDYDNNWGKTTLGNILTERNKQIIPSEDYPLVSFTVEKGVTAKTERYNRNFLVRTNNKKYKKTKIDDIVYNPANLKFGAIAKNRFGDAVLSPIYVTYKINKGFYPDFIELLVTSSEFIQRALSFQEGTVYERMAVKSKDFLTIEVKIPTYEEQVKIASLFMEISMTLNYLGSEIEYYDNLKKKLLNNLFV